MNKKTENLLCDIYGFTTTHTNNQHKTYTPSTTTTNTAANQQPQPPTTTTNQATKQASKLTKSSQASLARLRPLRRPCAWVRPLGCIWATSAASQQASKPASQQASQLATMGSGSTSAETRRTSASKPANKPRHRSTSPPNTASAALAGIR